MGGGLAAQVGIGGRCICPETGFSHRHDRGPLQRQLRDDTNHERRPLEDGADGCSLDQEGRGGAGSRGPVLPAPGRVSDSRELTLK